MLAYLSARPDLLVDDGRRLGGLDGGLDPDGLGVKVSRSDLGDMLAAVDLLVLLRVLVVVVGPQGQLGVADDAPEAAAVEEGEVLEGSDLVGGVDRLAAPEAAVFHVHLATAEHFRASHSTVCQAPKCGSLLNLALFSHRD